VNKSAKSSFKDPQTIIAIGVTVISLCALVVSLMQTRIMMEERALQHEYSRAAVWPRLGFGLAKGHNNDGSIAMLSLMLVNSGVGPAIITDVKVTYKGEIVKDWRDLFKIQEIPDSIMKRGIVNRKLNLNIVKIGETMEILNLNDNLPLAQAFYDRYDDLSIDIYYESIFKEKWKCDRTTATKLENFEGLPSEEQFND